MNKVFFFTSSLAYGGKERQIIEVVKLLSKSFCISIYILNAKQQSFAASIAKDINFYYVSPESKSIFSRIWSCYKTIRQGRPNLIHTMDALSTYLTFLPALMNKIPSVNGSIRHAGVTHGFDYYFEQLSLYLSDYIIANSAAGLRHYNILNNRKAGVIYNFIDKSRFIENRSQSVAIVMTANFTDYKDHKTFLTCAERLIKEKKIIRFNLLGDGPYTDKWKCWVREKGLADNFTFHGKVSNVEELLAENSIGVLCSTRKYKEGISNSILEYMGSGLLTIASDIGGTSEIITNRVNGLLFEVENPDSLYQNIIWALEHPDECAQMVRSAYLTLDEKFSATKNCEILIDIYTQLI
ncbi:MAG: glycosyltransferase family 4 protein [Candidatus Cloacimonetes bacterium]|nr:glycosyltransferase family 4 protein [Candidatus Cloacimonadota bacterium]